MARRSLRPVEAAVKDIQIVLGRGFVPLPTEISEVQGDLGKMRPTGKNKKFPRRPGRGATPGGVRVALTSEA